MTELILNRVASLKKLLASKNVIIISDMEGPLLLGDTAMQTMSKYVRPPNSQNFSLDYGAVLYRATYEWFNSYFRTKGVGQEGSDIALCVAPLLAQNVTDHQIVTIANNSKFMYGAEKLADFLLSNEGSLICVTTASEIAMQHRDLTVSSDSRLLMYILGIITSYDSNTPVTREQYKQLENTPQEKMIAVQENEYKAIIGELARSSCKNLILSHLVFALYIDKEITYLKDRLIPEWYVVANQSIIELIAPSDVIFKRRQKDGITRDRGSFTIDDIKYHQDLCDEKWERLTGIATETTHCYVVENIIKGNAVKEVEHAIYG